MRGGSVLTSRRWLASGSTCRCTSYIASGSSPKATMSSSPSSRSSCSVCYPSPSRYVVGFSPGELNYSHSAQTYYIAQAVSPPIAMWCKSVNISLWTASDALPSRYAPLGYLRRRLDYDPHDRLLPHTLEGQCLAAVRCFVFCSCAAF